MADEARVVFVFTEKTHRRQLSSVWEHFADLGTAGDPSKHIHDPSLAGFVTDDEPNDEVLWVGKDRIIGKLQLSYSDIVRLGTPDLPFVELVLRQSRYEQDEGDGRESKGAATADLVREIYAALDPKPDVVYGLSDAGTHAIAGNFDRPPVDEASLTDSLYNYTTWLTTFPPEFVATYGEDRLRSAPVWRTFEFDDGTLLLLYSPMPTDPGSYADVDHHLGIEPSGL